MALEAAAEVCLVLRELGHEADLVRRPAGVRGPGGLRLEVGEAPTSTIVAVRRTLKPSDEAVGLLVTSRLCPAHREALAAAGAGWLDRRGELCVPPLDIETAVAPMDAPLLARDDVWQRRGVLAVALALLQHEGPVPVTWDLGFYAGLTGGGVSLATQTLRALELIDEHDHPRREELFIQLAARWRTCWFPLAALPDVEQLEEHARLLIAGHDDLRQPGWALLPRTPDEPTNEDDAALPRLLLADQRALAWLLRTCGMASGTDTAVALVAATPSPVALAQRQAPVGDTAWPTAHPVTAALEHASPGFRADRATEVVGQAPAPTGPRSRWNLHPPDREVRRR
jgi:hypothetical protein